MTRKPIRGNSKENGAALLFVLFLLLVVIIGASTAILRYKAEGRREKEAVMIWRGEQYQRAIGLYYRKFGRYPTSMDQLVQGVNGVRYLREAYKDPMNKEDGSWRFIYVTPAGILVGSVRYISLQQMALEDRARIMGISLSQETGAGNAQSQGQDQDQDNGAGAPPGASDQNGNGSAPETPPANGSGAGSSTGNTPPNPSGQQAGAPPQPAPAQLAPFGVMQQSQPPGAQLQDNESEGQIVGGFIVGVASKIDKPSLKVYKGGGTYKQWEFIYNPLEQTQSIGGGTVISSAGAIGGIISQQPGTPIPQQPQQPQIPQIPQPQQ